MYTAKDVYVCEASSSVYFCYLCAASWYICLSGRLGPCVCQDAPSFGNSLSRCSIFRQVALLSSVCVCVCICVCAWAFGSSCMSECSILRQQPVKMSHLSSGDPFVLCVCVCVWASGSLCMSGCSILWQQPVKMFHLSSGDPFVLCVCICVCVWAFGSSCMSGCSILRLQPVKMFHLSSGDPFCPLCVCVCVCVSGRLGPRVCQDAPSFGNSLSRCSIFRQVTFCPLCVCVSGRLGPCVCQDAPSFGNSLSRCSIFRQVTFCPLCVCVCLGVWVLVYVRMLHPLATACQDVPSFVR